MSAARRAQPATRSTGLQAQAEIEANEKHSRRLAELQTLAPMLAQLDALMPSLTAQGINKVYPDQLGLTHHRSGERRLKVLRVNVGTLWDKTRPARWLAALLQAGFSTVQHHDNGDYSSAVMRRGSLLLEIDVPPIGPVKPPAPRPAQAAAQAVPA